MGRAVITGSTDQSIRFWAYDAAGAAVTGEAYNSAGMAVSVVVRSAGRILSTTALTLVARSGAGVHTDSALTEVGGGEYVVDLPDSYSAIAERDISLTVASTAITGAVLVEMLAVGQTLSAAQVNAEMLDVLNVDVFGELVAPPAASSSLRDKLTWVFMCHRNLRTETATQRKLFADNGSTLVGTEAVSDDGTTFTKGEVA